MNLIELCGIYATICIGFCSAQPIPSLGPSDQNRFILGALIFLSFGAVLTGCVCCRRRKKGFEEFSNDSGNLETNKNEYPIFRALSPENQRSNSNEGANEVFEYNDSHENLIVNDADNNNVPISPADLQNIENNNAVNLIENRNNIDIEVESSQFSVVQLDDSDQLLDSISSSQNEIQIISSESDPIPHNETNNLQTESNQDLVIFNEKEISDMYKNNESNNLLEYVPIANQNAKISLKPENEEFIQTVIENPCIEATIKLSQTGSEDIIYESKSLENLKEDEENGDEYSIEEALRVLDTAIENEEYLNDYCADECDDKDQLPLDTLSSNSDDYHTVIRDLLTSGVKETMPDLINDNSYSKGNYVSENLNDIRYQLAEFVDDILNESLTTIQKSERNFIVNHCTVNEDEKKVHVDRFNYFSDTPRKNSNPELLDEFFSDEIMNKTSTPCVNSKFRPSRFSNKFPPKLFDETYSNSPLERSLGEDNQDIQKEINGTIRMEINNVTFDAVNETFDIPLKNNDFIFPGDPCTSKQAIERDQIIEIRCQRDEIVKSEDLNTITPVNTPIELNYNQETWAKMTQTNEDDSKNGWFLHPQMFANETTDVFDDDETEENLELTFESLRKQLAEVLPHPQGMAGPPEYSDDENETDTNRTFDEYRSPLDGLYGLLEIDSAPLPKDEQIEMFINYKRQLSPIMEESEDESCRTFAVNETKCMDSTSTGCVGTVEAIMGVTKVLMASNDTLFNFEDTLGDTEDALSSLLSSHNNSEATTPVKSNRPITKCSQISYNNDQQIILQTDPNNQLNVEPSNCKKLPPTTINFAEEMLTGNDFNSPDQQKTYSEGTGNSSTTDRQSSSDICPTLDNEVTNDDKTCVTIMIKDDEHSLNNTYSNLVETVSKELNSDYIEDHQHLPLAKENTLTDNIISSSDIIGSSSADIEFENDDSCHSIPTEGISNASQYITAQESESTEDKSPINSKITTMNPSKSPLPDQHSLEKINNTGIFSNDMEYLPSKSIISEKGIDMIDTSKHLINIDVVDKTSHINTVNAKENIDPNISDRFTLKHDINNDKNISIEEVQTNSREPILTKNLQLVHNGDILQDCIENGSPTNNTIYDKYAFDDGRNFYFLSEPNEIDIKPTCFAKSDDDNSKSSLQDSENENDDTNSSSEEFMYVRGPVTQSNTQSKNLKIDSSFNHDHMYFQMEKESGDLSENSDFVHSPRFNKIDETSAIKKSKFAKSNCSNEDLDALVENVDNCWTNNELEISTTNLIYTNKVDNKRPDSGVGETGEMCNFQSNISLSIEKLSVPNSPDALIPTLKSNEYTNDFEKTEKQNMLPELINLRSPFSTGSVDSLSSSSSSEKQLNISKLNENNRSTKNELPIFQTHNLSDNIYIKLNEKDKIMPNIKQCDYDQSKEAIIQSNEIVAENIKHGDSTDEDSGIESIMRVNK